MKQYIIEGAFLHFRQTSLPRMFFIVIDQLGYYVHLTGCKRYPYKVQITESEFLSTIELAREF